MPTDVRYKYNRMRPHLLECLERGKFSDFPSSKLPSKFINYCENIHKLNYASCYCGVSDVLAPMMSCDFCASWFHLPCAGFQNLNYQTVLARNAQNPLLKAIDTAKINAKDCFKSTDLSQYKQR
jgi:hypothetical protein